MCELCSTMMQYSASANASVHSKELSHRDASTQTRDGTPRVPRTESAFRVETIEWMMSSSWNSDHRYDSRCSDVYMNGRSRCITSTSASVKFDPYFEYLLQPESSWNSSDGFFARNQSKDLKKNLRTEYFNCSCELLNLLSISFLRKCAQISTVQSLDSLSCASRDVAWHGLHSDYRLRCTCRAVPLMSLRAHFTAHPPIHVNCFEINRKTRAKLLHFHFTRKINAITLDFMHSWQHLHAYTVSLCVEHNIFLINFSTWLVYRLIVSYRVFTICHSCCTRGTQQCVCGVGVDSFTRFIVRIIY